MDRRPYQKRMDFLKERKCGLQVHDVVQEVPLFNLGWFSDLKYTSEIVFNSTMVATQNCQVYLDAVPNSYKC